jgi:hypothetical protein
VAEVAWSQRPRLPSTVEPASGVDVPALAAAVASCVLISALLLAPAAPVTRMVGAALGRRHRRRPKGRDPC